MTGVQTCALPIFQEITALLQATGAVQAVADAGQLGARLCEWLAQPEQRKRRGEAGRVRIEAERGALARTLKLVDASLAQAQLRSTDSSAASASATR